MFESIQGAPVATVIMGVTILTSFLVMNSRQDLYRALILHPYSLVREKTWYTLITSGLIHGDIGHLLFNMFTFFFFAFPLERFMGSGRFAVLYVVSLVLSDISTIVKHRNNKDYYCLGASGAVSAVVFSCIIYAPHASIFIMLIPIPIPAPLFGVLYLFYCYYAARKGRGHINHDAHMWGALSGLILTALLDPAAYAGFFEYLKGLL